MSKLFFDSLVNLEKIDRHIKSISETSDEREELWRLVDEIVHHKVMGVILSNLPRNNHVEFLEIYHASPYDEFKIFEYLNIRIGENIKDLIIQELGIAESEILDFVSKK
jgi:hypothetical protein